MNREHNTCKGRGGREWNCMMEGCTLLLCNECIVIVLKHNYVPKVFENWWKSCVMCIKLTWICHSPLLFD